MKRLSFVFAAALGLMACGDNSNNYPGSGGSIDSASMLPPASEPDNTNVHPDSVMIDSSAIRPNGDSSSRGTGYDKTNKHKDATGSSSKKAGNSHGDAEDSLGTR